jgi:hypothetical protein
MSGFGGNSGQDWTAVNVGRSAAAKKPVTAGDKAAELARAKRQGVAITAQRMTSGNKSSSGTGPMATSAGKLP